jgi:hypothetical protein
LLTRVIINVLIQIRGSEGVQNFYGTEMDFYRNKFNSIQFISKILFPLVTMVAVYITIFLTMIEDLNYFITVQYKKKTITIRVSWLFLPYLRISNNLCIQKKSWE